MLQTALPSYLRRMISAADFGAIGDGVTDDTSALQAAFDATFTGTNRALFLEIAPGDYKVSKTLRIAFDNTILAVHAGILAHGARFVSTITNATPVFHITAVNNSLVRFFLIDGLQIAGSGADSHGLFIEVNSGNSAFYDSRLQGISIEHCGQDGCRLMGNVFESCIYSSHFRDNGGNGLTLGHAAAPGNGILSAMHVFGSIFGNNTHHGAQTLNNAYDISFRGCYFLENGENGFHAHNGFSLLTNCGFENNWTSAATWSQNNYAIWAQNFGTIVQCTGTTGANHKQGTLISMYVVSVFTMISGSAEGAGTAPAICLLKGTATGKATLIGCNGQRVYEGSFASRTTEIGTIP